MKKIGVMFIKTIKYYYKPYKNKVYNLKRI